jgi:DNA-binding MarR family transcriptional regulator
LLIANIANSTVVDNEMEKNIVDLIIELKKACMEDEKQIRTLCNISLAEYQGIMKINITERITCNILSQKMGLSPSRGSRIIDGLVRKGYLLRTTNPEDRRSFVLSLSSKGIKIRKQIEQERNNCERRIREKLSTEELELIKEG